MQVKTWELAIKQAKANAKSSGVDWIVFTSSSGVPQCERYDTHKIEGAVIVNPQGSTRSLILDHK